MAVEPDCPRAHIAPSSRSRASDCDAAFPARSRLAGWVRERLWEFSVQPRVPLPRMPARTMIGIVPVTSTVSLVTFMGNPEFDEEIAELNSDGSALLTPFVTQLAMDSIRYRQTT